MSEPRFKVGDRVTVSNNGGFMHGETVRILSQTMGGYVVGWHGGPAGLYFEERELSPAPSTPN